MPATPRSLRYFVPRCTNGSYYHFITESALGLYLMLAENDELVGKDCHLWYNGGWGSIIQLFSKHAVVHVPGKTPFPSHEAMSAMSITQLKRQRINQPPRNFNELIPLSRYLAEHVTARSESKGITVIRRTGKREYSGHDELIRRLKQFGKPVREAEFQHMHFHEQINLMKNTHLLIAPHGAGTLNMIFMNAGSKIIELFPKGCHNKNAFTIATVFGHVLIELEGETSGSFHKQPPREVTDWIGRHGWPTRQIFENAQKTYDWPNFRRLFRAIRDVSSFSVTVDRVINAVAQIV